ncbi:MAG: hypothetical protein KBS97_03120 [Firmicutes bacterium]|nr:hypothetical protein [Candidatus Fiminaster equi]
MEKSISKKLFAGVCALSAGFILAACDPISAVPSNYNDPIVQLKENNGAVNDDDNKIGKIYDALASDRNTKIVSDLLDEVALGRYGSYKDIVDANASNETKLNYVKKFKKVFQREDDKDKFKDVNLDDIYVKRFDNFYADVMARINEFFYNEITSGSYNDDEGRFDEVKLFMAHYYEFYEIDYPKESDGSYKEHKFFVTNEITKKTNFFDATEKYHLIGTYSNPGKRGYIEEKVFPQILKDKLVEEYVFNTNYSALGRAYARKVNYIKVSYESDIVPWELLKNFGNDYVADGSVSAPLLANFEIIAKALKGFDTVGSFKGADQGIVTLENSNGAEGSEALKLLKKTIDPDNAGYTEKNSISISDPEQYKLGDDVLIPAGSTFFKDTKIGELVDSYEKAIKAEQSGRFPIASEKAELDKFTANGKSKEYGLREKLIALAKEDYTTDGWFVKNGGLSELPAALRDRLFNINVASSLDDRSLNYETNIETAEKVGDVWHYPLGAYEYEASEGVKGKDLKRMPYLRNINNVKFVIPAKAEKFDTNHYNYIYQDVEGKAFYMVVVDEAPSTPKLNMDSSTSYSKLDETKGDIFKTEEIARAVAKVLGTKDSYIKDAYTEILKGYNFEFYETSLYEHFKSEYPDLFDEE